MHVSNLKSDFTREKIKIEKNKWHFWLGNRWWGIQWWYQIWFKTTFNCGIWEKIFWVCCLWQTNSLNRKFDLTIGFLTIDYPVKSVICFSLSLFVRGKNPISNPKHACFSIKSQISKKQKKISKIWAVIFWKRVLRCWICFSYIFNMY